MARPLLEPTGEEGTLDFYFTDGDVTEWDDDDELLDRREPDEFENEPTWPRIDPRIIS